MAATDPTRRFSNRVNAYAKWRPGYPAAIVDLLTAECGLAPQSIIADVGSGTGILSELFLKNGNRVFGVEPNREMREAGERLLQGYPQFQSVDGRAEVTTLPSASVDFITAGQSFHWFDQKPTRTEFARILRPGGWVVLIWNEFRAESSPLVAGYQRLLEEYGTDYRQVWRDLVDEEIEPFYLPGHCQKRVFYNEQLLAFEGLKGRLLSASYAPDEDHPNHQPMLQELRQVFDENQKDGQVIFPYDTRVYFGGFNIRGLEKVGKDVLW
jgi:SAM-dependent methyltransferase